MWITIKKTLKKGAVVFWPGSEVKIEGHYPSHYLPYDRSLSFEKRIDLIYMYNVRARRSFKLFGRLI